MGRRAPGGRGRNGSRWRTGRAPDAPRRPRRTSSIRSRSSVCGTLSEPGQVAARRTPVADRTSSSSTEPSSTESRSAADHVVSMPSSTFWARNPAMLIGVLRAAERRRVGELELGEVVDGHAGAQRRGEDVDALVDARSPPTAWAPSSRPSGREDHREVDRPRRRGSSRRGYPGAGGPRGARRRQRARRRDVGPVTAAVTPKTRTIAVPRTGLDGDVTAHDRVGGGAALTVGRAGQRDDAGRAGDEVDDLDRVAHGPDVRVARLLRRRHDDGALRARARGPRRARAPVDGRTPTPRSTTSAPMSRDPRRRPGRRRPAWSSGSPRPRPGRAGAHVDVVGPQLGLDQAGHVGVEGGQDLGRELDEADVEAAVPERLDGLETDEPGADHDRRRRTGVEHRAQRVGVGHVAQRADLRAVEPGSGGTIGSAPVASTSASYEHRRPCPRRGRARSRRCGRPGRSEMTSCRVRTSRSSEARSDLRRVQQQRGRGSRISPPTW